MRYYTTYAISEFPDSTFYPLLLANFKQAQTQSSYDRELWNILFQAFARYPNSQTVSILSGMLRSQTTSWYQERALGILVAITKYPDPIFASLKKEIKLDEEHQWELGIPLR